MIDSYIKAGKLASKIRDEASKMIKDGTLVIDLVEYVESENDWTVKQFSHFLLFQLSLLT